MAKDKTRANKNLQELTQILSMVKEKELIEDFLYCLLTPAEADDIARRWELVKALWKETPQREIAQKLGISLCKITRGSRELKKDNSAFKRILKKYEKNIDFSKFT